MAVEFLARSGNQGFFKRGLLVKIILNNVSTRKLYADSDHRSPLIHPRVTHAKKLFVESELSMEEIIKSSINISNKFILEILDGFGYNLSDTSVMADQDSFMSGVQKKKQLQSIKVHLVLIVFLF